MIARRTIPAGRAAEDPEATCPEASMSSFTPLPAAPRAVLEPTDPRLGAWRAFLEAHARVTRRLDDELRAEHGLSLAEYDALLQLARAEGRRLRMNVLADRVILSRSGVTRLIDRLEAAGLVERAACPSDARGAEAVLTRTGLARLRTASSTHLRGIEEHFLAELDAADLEAIEQGLGGVARRACEPAEPTQATEPATVGTTGGRHG
jgi:DNA-binding MarR family transcriptional regulator